MFRDFFKNKRNIFEAFAVFLFLLILAGGFSFGFSGQSKFLAAVTPICGEGEPCGGGGGGGGGGGILPPPPPPPTAYTLSVSKTGTGAGTITSSQPSKITCGALCSSIFNSGDPITLYMSPSTGSVFASWSGCSSIGTNNSCVVTMNATRTVTANFISIIPPAPLPLLHGTANSYVVENCANDGGTVNTIGDTKVCTDSSALFPSCSFLSIGRWSLYSSRCTLRFLIACLRYEVNCIPDSSVLSSQISPKPEVIDNPKSIWNTIKEAIEGVVGKDPLPKPSTPVFIDLKVNNQDGPLTVFKDSTVTVSWVMNGFSACGVYDGEILPFTALGTSGSKSKTISADTTFSISCGGKIYDSVAVTAVPLPPPPEPFADVKVKDPATGSFTDSDISVVQGSTITLRVNFSNVETCQMSPTGWTYSSLRDEEGLPIDKTTTASANTTYTLSCSGEFGTADDKVTINVILKPAANIKVNGSDSPLAVEKGTSVTISWTSTNSNSCSVTSNPLEVYSGSGTSSPVPSPQKVINGATIFTLSCAGAGGSATDSVTQTIKTQPKGGK